MPKSLHSTLDVARLLKTLINIKLKDLELYLIRNNLGKYTHQEFADMNYTNVFLLNSYLIDYINARDKIDCEQ